MTEQSHRADPRVLNRRTLRHDHRRLVDFLRPGMDVLDIGCGTGAITAGIAGMVGPEGYVMGIDRDESLLAIARREHHGIRNLEFEKGDVLSLAVGRRFDIVTTARMLQWVSDSEQAIRGMRKVTKNDGRVVVLDYNHEDHTWTPEPPPAFRRFFNAFLEWRSESGWDNRIADALPVLFQAVGISDVQIHVDDEIVQRDDPEFFAAVEIWSHVIETIGATIVTAGFLAEGELLEAAKRYQDFMQTRLQRQLLSMRTVHGRVAESGSRVD